MKRDGQSLKTHEYQVSFRRKKWPERGVGVYPEKLLVLCTPIKSQLNAVMQIKVLPVILHLDVEWIRHGEGDGVVLIGGICRHREFHVSLQDQSCEVPIQPFFWVKVHSHPPSPPPSLSQSPSNLH